MGLSLSPYLSETTPRWQRDARVRDGRRELPDDDHALPGAGPSEQGNPHFMLASGGSMYVVWATASLVGALAGRHLRPARVGARLRDAGDVPHDAAPAGRLAAASRGRRRRGDGRHRRRTCSIPGKWYIILAVVAATVTGVVLETRAETGAAR